jgi:hypothetical protein
MVGQRGEIGLYFFPDKKALQNFRHSGPTGIRPKARGGKISLGLHQEICNISMVSNRS